MNRNSALALTAAALLLFAALYHSRSSATSAAINVAGGATPTPTPSCNPAYGIADGFLPFSFSGSDLGNHCDNCTSTINLAWFVSFYGERFSHITVDSNGRAFLQGGTAAASNTCLPNAGDTYAIYPYWDDLRTDDFPACSQYPSGCGIFWNVSGSVGNRTLTIQWRTVYAANTAMLANFELVLYEAADNFHVIYSQADMGNTTATAGVQRDANSFTQDFCNGNGGPPAGDRAYAFYLCGPPTPTPTPTPTPSPSPVSVTVGTNPAGLAFIVDATNYNSTQTFNWLTGSSHNLSTTSPQNVGGGTRYLWSNWSDGGAQTHDIFVTGMSNTYTANFATQYLLQMGGSVPVTPPTGFFDAGQSVQIQAFPYCFHSVYWFGSGNGSYTGSNNPATVVMNGPITENAIDEGPTCTPSPPSTPTPTPTPTPSPAPTISGTPPIWPFVDLDTIPGSCCSYQVNGTSRTGRTFLYLPPGPAQLGTTSPQMGPAGIRYVWKRWNDAGAITHQTEFLQQNNAYAFRAYFTISRPAFDCDGDRVSDISVFRPPEGVWYLQQSQNGFAAASFGVPTDRIAPADLDGDGKTDIAVYRPSSGTWYWLNSSNGVFHATQFGAPEDLPVPADYDGDNSADVCVYRPSNAVWYRLNSSNGAFSAMQFGLSGDKPTIGDYDGDGRADVAVFRPSNGAWYRLNSSNGQFVAVGFGLSTDLITPADFDGDGMTDIAVYRPSTGIWYSLNSSNGSLVATQFGAAEDLPTAADYDGDLKADICVFRPSSGIWYRLNSINGAFVAIQFGANGDRPTPAAFRY